MTSTSSFNASNWISTNCTGAQNLLPETIVVVANFALMWNFFEGVMCKRQAGVVAFEQCIAEISGRVVHHDGIEEAITFWTFRYWTGTEFQDHFNDLHFRKSDRKDHVEAVLRGDMADFGSKILAVLIIVYRLRNNLFHGIKTIDMLNDQAKNLDMGCRALAAVLEVSGTHLVRGHKEANKSFERTGNVRA